MHSRLNEIVNDEFTSLHRGEGEWDDNTRSKAIAGFENLRETARNLALDIFRSDVVLMVRSLPPLDCSLSSPPWFQQRFSNLCLTRFSTKPPKTCTTTQYPGTELAIALLRVALRLLKEKRRLPPNYNFITGPGEGSVWYVKRGMSEERMEAILKEVYAFLNRKVPHPSKYVCLSISFVV